MAVCSRFSVLCSTVTSIPELCMFGDKLDEQTRYHTRINVHSVLKHLKPEVLWRVSHKADKIPWCDQPHGDVSATRGSTKTGRSILLWFFMDELVFRGHWCSNSFACLTFVPFLTWYIYGTWGFKRATWHHNCVRLNGPGTHAYELAISFTASNTELALAPHLPANVAQGQALTSTNNTYYKLYNHLKNNIANARPFICESLATLSDSLNSNSKPNHHSHHHNHHNWPAGVCPTRGCNPGGVNSKELWVSCCR